MDTEKQIGLVKWFHDQVKDANYGFIQHHLLGELFFHETSIEKGQDIQLFVENQIVVFIPKTSQKHEGKLDALEVKHISTETDLKFLFGYFLSLLTEKEKYPQYEYAIIKRGIYPRIELLLESRQELRGITFIQFQEFVTEQIDNPLNNNEEFFKALLNICKRLFADNNDHISRYIAETINRKIAHNLWLENHIEICQVNYIASVILTADVGTKRTIFAKCTIEDKTNILNKILEEFVFINSIEQFEKIKAVHIISEDYASEIEEIVYNKIQEVIDTSIEKGVSVELLHKFWLEEYSSICQIVFIASFILTTGDKTRKAIFELCTPEDKLNIFFKVVSDIESGVIEFNIGVIKATLKLSKEFATHQHDSILKETLRICPDHFKLNLWLEDYHDTLDFNSYKPYIITLAPQNQKRFVKKVLNYIHENKATITVDDLTSLNLIDYETSKLAEQIDDSHLDYSTSIILNVISELKNKTNLETKKVKLKIYDLILKQIKEPKDILQITGFFDECGGRCNATVSLENNEQGEGIKKVNYKRDEHKKAKNHPICDGRKSEKLSAESQLEFWWCANQPCFKPSRELHNSSEWEKYTLFDFLNVLKVEFSEKDFEIYLNIINKANRFLKHLKCRECNHILYPKGKSKFAFYGINRFACVTENCTKKGEEIYLSHCLNGFCEMEIDSRDCVKCKPIGKEQDECGWYVCNNCHSCCSTPQLESRKNAITRNTNEEYKCHLVGHRDLGVISCNKCGSNMEPNKFEQDEYTKILNWFIENKENQNHIASSGQRTNDNKWWFRLKKGTLNQEEFHQKLVTLLNIGFRIPDFEEQKSIYLVTERNNRNERQVQQSELLVCSNKECNHIVDLSNDLEKARAVKQFHTVRYVRQTAET